MKELKDIIQTIPNVLIPQCIQFNYCSISSNLIIIMACSLTLT